MARRQLVAAGVSGSAVRRMIASGWLDPVHAGVYLVAGRSLAREAAWMAAVLAGGSNALLSHRSAGELWCLLEPIEGPCHVTVPHGRHSHADLVMHATRRPDRGIVRNHIPVTTPTRTLFDLATTLSARQLEGAIEAADRHDLLDVARLTRLCKTTRGRKGTGRLSALLAHHRPLPETRSDLERRFLRLCRDAGIPPPAVNVPVAGVEVDFVWPGSRLAVELDGYAFHRHRAAFERDRRRDATLQAAGYHVLRITYMRLVEEPDAIVAELHTLLRPVGPLSGHSPSRYRST